MPVLTDERLYWYTARLDRVIDGDTVVLHIDLGLHVTKLHVVRLYGINAPEIRGPHRTTAGREATDFLKSLLTTKDTLFVKTIRDQTGKYGRLLAALFLDNGECIQRKMVESGFAQRTCPLPDHINVDELYCPRCHHAVKFLLNNLTRASAVSQNNLK